MYARRPPCLRLRCGVCLILIVGVAVSRWVSRWLLRALARIVIPNRKISGEILHNFGNLRQLEITVAVAYDTDLNRAMAAIDEVLRANPRVLPDPKPVVQTILLGDSSVSIGVRPWVQVPDYVAAAGEVNRSVLELLRERGIVMPFPQREVRLIGNAA